MIEIHPKTSQAYRLLHDGTLAFSRAEQQGIRVDLERCEQQKKDLTDEIEKRETAFYDTKFYRHWEHSAGGKINVHSNAQLAKYLYGTKKLEPVSTTASGQGSTDEDALSQLGVPELTELIQIRKLKKIRDTYLDAYLREAVNGVIHPSFNLHLVRTFRSSSDRPNFQNIPKRDKEAMKLCRRVLFPRPGHQLMEVDYSGLEVRIAACYHKDPTMLKYITDPTTDMHRDMAETIYMMDEFDKSLPQHKVLRAAAKNGFVFPEFYGDYYKNCAASLACGWGKLPQGRWRPGDGVEVMPGVALGGHLINNGIRSLNDFMEHIKKIESHFWRVRFPVYDQWKERWWKGYLKNGYIDLLTGFRCGGSMGRNDAVNYPVQGAAFHCLLWSFIRLDYWLKANDMRTRLVGQIHDAIVLDVHPDERDDVGRALRRIMCDDLRREWEWINVPMDVEADLGGVDESWADIKYWELPK